MQPLPNAMPPSAPQPTAVALTEFHLPLRLAQRAFAALLEAAWRKESGPLRLAGLRRAAARTLSALSADDRSRLSRWLSLLLASDSAHGTEVAWMLASVAPGLAMHVDAMLAGARRELSARRAVVAA